MARVIVVGGGVCGLATALILSTDGHDVVVFERDADEHPLDASGAWEGWSRRSVGQFRQPHLIIAPMKDLLEKEWPKVLSSLRALGAAESTHLRFPPTMMDRTRRPSDSEFETVTARRPTLELAFARAAGNAQRLDLRRGEVVSDLLSGASDQPGVVHVRGVRTERGDEVEADLVIDAAGRNSQLSARLQALGASALAESKEERGFVYTSQFFTAQSGSLPEGLAPMLIPAGSVALLILPGDNNSWSVTICRLGEDAPLRRLQPQTFRAIVASFQDFAHFLDGEPIGPVGTMAAGTDAVRTTTVDGAPVATGVLPIADSFAYTNPMLGRGMFFGLSQAVVVRNVMRREDSAQPATLWANWDRAIASEVWPWLAATHNLDRARAEDMRAAIRGGAPVAHPDDRGAAFGRAFAAAAAIDPDVLRWQLRLAACRMLPGELFRTTGVAERITQLAAENPAPPPAAVPSRADLLRLVTG